MQSVNNNDEIHTLAFKIAQVKKNYLWHDLLLNASFKSKEFFLFFFNRLQLQVHTCEFNVE